MYMLLNVEKINNNSVDGVHIQWCSGCTLEQAKIRARETEKSNGNRITVAVVDEIYNSYAIGKYYTNLERLDL